MDVKTILVVDDEFYNAEVLVFVLEEEGYRVLTASNGRDALDKLIVTDIDLVVLDMMMPIMDGPELGRIMRRDEKLAVIPILMTSALTDAGVRAQFDQFDAILRKPFQISQVLEQVRTLLSSPPTASSQAQATVRPIDRWIG